MSTWGKLPQKEQIVAKMKTKSSKGVDFRVKLMTEDGVLVANREGESDVWLKADGTIDKEFAEYSMRIDCAEKGVKLIRYAKSPTGIDATVEWFK